MEQGKNKRTIVIVGEGDEVVGATIFKQLLKEQYDVDAHIAILGHIQRGGSPTVRDRVLATRLGVAAVDALLEGKTDVMVGEINGDISYTSFEDTWTKRKPLHDYLIRLSDILA